MKKKSDSNWPVFCCRYGLPVNFQAMILRPQKKMSKRLRDALNQLYSHLDNSAYTGGGAIGGDVSPEYKLLFQMYCSTMVARIAAVTCS